jgi:hypothetical protein
MLWEMRYAVALEVGIVVVVVVAVILAVIAVGGPSRRSSGQSPKARS